MRGETRKAAAADPVPLRFYAAIRHLRALGLALLWMALAQAACTAQTVTDQPATLTTIRAVHLLSHAEAARAHPVHLQAVVVYYDPYIDRIERPLMMVSDGTASIYLGLPGRATVPLKAGTLLEIDGVSDPGDFAPSILNAKIRVLGQAPLPANSPRETMTHLLTGSEDAQWVEMEGVVRSVEFSEHNVTLKLTVGDGEMAATSLKEAGANYQRLVDAKIRIRAVAATLFNRKNQIIGVRLLFPDLSTVWIEQPAPEDPFLLPVSPIRDVMRYSPGKAFNHRVHLRGVVALFWPGRLLCIQDGAEALCAATTQQTPLEPEQRVDLVGFPQIGGVTPTLDDATYGPLPDLRAISVDHIDADQAFGGSYDAHLIQLDGRLIAHDKASPDPTLVVSSGKYTFSVILPKTADAQSLLKLEEGSNLRITGICTVQADAKVFTRHDGYPVARYFQITLRSAKDVTVLRRPSWWNARHTLSVLAGALGVTLCILGWVVFLQIRVKRQTALLEYQATHDGLTGIWNRKAVLDLLRREFDIAARSNKKIGVVMLDADHFKNVNDTYGHLAGDAVLKELARRIQNALRSYDLTGRYGGEEFLIVLPGCTEEDVLVCAERVRASVADDPISAEGSDLAVTVSVGTAVLDPLQNSQRDALAAADGALYRAKHSGRNRVVCGELKPQSA